MRDGLAFGHRIALRHFLGEAGSVPSRRKWLLLPQKRKLFGRAPRNILSKIADSLYIQFAFKNWHILKHCCLSVR